MGARMRAHDWAASPLGPPASWPRALQTLVAVLLGSHQPMFVAWGAERTMLYNDGYAAICGARHPGALGRPFREVWFDIMDAVGPILERAYAGHPTHMDDIAFTLSRNGYPEEAHFAFSYTPVRDGSGAVAGMFCACTETTGKVMADRRQAFLLSLERRLRALADAREAMAEAAGLLGRHLGADSAGYAEAEADGEAVHVACDWTTPGTPSLAGRHRLDDFGPALAAALRAGRALRVDDVAADPLTRGHAGAFAGIGVRALLDVPLVKDGRLAAILFVMCATPRRWTDAEAALVTEVAERTWAAVARARAEAALRESEARFRNAADSSPALMWMTDEAGEITFANERYRRFFGVETDAMLGAGWRSIVHPGDVDAFHDAFREAFARRAPFHRTVRVLHPHLGVRWLSCDGGPRFGRDGAFLGYTGVNIEVTEATLAEAALRESEERLRLIVESVRDYAIFLADAEDRIETWLPGAARIFGWEADAIIGQPGALLFTPEDREAGVPEAEVRMAERDGSAPNVRWHMRRDGARVFIEGATYALRRGDGSLRGFLKIGQDVTARKAAEERQALLAREVDHRAKNALAVVQTMLRLTRAEDIPRFARAVEGRVAALARAQTLLAEVSWDGADLRALLEGELSPFLAGQRAVLDGAPVMLPPGVAQPIAMAVHELATNAAKHGALSAPGGQVVVGWAMEPGGQLRLRWAEGGGPPVAGPPGRRGFGSRVLEGTVAHQLGGSVRLDWHPGGLVCEMEVPLRRETVP
jgi:PAS domain S-box-containing protein